MPSHIEIFGVKYYGKINTRTRLAKFMCRDYCYGTQLNITFDTPEEFFDKVYEKIPQEIKDEYEQKLPYHVASTETKVLAVTQELADLKVSVENRLDRHDVQISINTEGHSLHDIIIRRHEETIQSHEAKIVSLESRVSTLESENIDLRKDVSSLQSEVSFLNKIKLEKRSDTKLPDNLTPMELIGHERTINRNRKKDESNVEDQHSQRGTMVVYDESKICSLETELWKNKEDIENLSKIIEAFNIQSLTEIVMENRQITQEDRLRFDNLNNMLLDFNNRIAEQERKTKLINKNVKVTYNRTVDNENEMLYTRDERISRRRKRGPTEKVD